MSARKWLPRLDLDPSSQVDIGEWWRCIDRVLAVKPEDVNNGDVLGMPTRNGIGALVVIGADGSAEMLMARWQKAWADCKAYWLAREGAVRQ